MIKFRFMKKLWRLFVVDQVDDQGSMGEADDVRRTVLIRRDLRGRTRLIVVLHELLHIGNWRRSEEEVEQLSQVMGNLLWDLGYRLPDDRPFGPS